MGVGEDGQHWNTLGTMGYSVNNFDILLYYVKYEIKNTRISKFLAVPVAPDVPMPVSFPYISAVHHYGIIHLLL